jgi:FdhD protein
VRRSSPVRDVDVVRVRGASEASASDWIAVEEPLAVLVSANGEAPAPLAVTMRTPGHDEELAVGFLFGEGLVASRADLGEPACEPGPEAEGASVVVRLARALDEDVAPRAFAVSASCGVCGAASLDRLVDVARRLGPGPSIAADTLLALPSALRAAQRAFDRTGGLHAAGLFTAAGAAVLVREDVGRHNAVDKLAGRALLDGAVPLEHAVLFVSGRVSFEIVQKAARMGVAVLAAVSAPTRLAVQAAERVGMTLVGFVRDGGFNVYAHPARVAR